VFDKFQGEAINLERTINQSLKVNHENILIFEQDVQQYRGSYMEKNSYGWAAIKIKSIQQCFSFCIDYLVGS